MVFDKVLQHVNAYFQSALDAGQDPEEVMQSFRFNPLPTELTRAIDATDKELRRIGQILSTQYILDKNDLKSRVTTVPGQKLED